MGDTNFRFVCDDGGAAPSDVDTGIPVDTDVHYLRITAESATSVLVEMLDPSMTLEASQTFTAASHQLPATTTFMHPMAAQQNLAASQTNDVHLYYCHGVNKA